MAFVWLIRDEPSTNLGTHATNSVTNSATLRRVAEYVDLGPIVSREIVNSCPFAGGTPASSSPYSIH